MSLYLSAQNRASLVPCDLELYRIFMKRQSSKYCVCATLRIRSTHKQAHPLSFRSTRSSSFSPCTRRRSWIFTVEMRRDLHHHTCSEWRSSHIPILLNTGTSQPTSLYPFTITKIHERMCRRPHFSFSPSRRSNLVLKQ